MNNKFVPKQETGPVRRILLEEAYTYYKDKYSRYEGKKIPFKLETSFGNLTSVEVEACKSLAYLYHDSDVCDKIRSLGLENIVDKMIEVAPESEIRSGEMEKEIHVVDIRKVIKDLEAEKNRRDNGKQDGARQ